MLLPMDAAPDSVPLLLWLLLLLLLPSTLLPSALVPLPPLLLSWLWPPPLHVSWCAGPLLGLLHGCLHGTSKLLPCLLLGTMLLPPETSWPSVLEWKQLAVGLAARLCCTPVAAWSPTAPAACSATLLGWRLIT